MFNSIYNINESFAFYDTITLLYMITSINCVTIRNIHKFTAFIFINYDDKVTIL